MLAGLTNRLVTPVSESCIAVNILMHSLRAGLNPESIAVVGGKEAGRVLQQCAKAGFEGKLWAVNPDKDEIAGIACFNRVTDLPAAPDVAFVAIPAEATIDVIHALSMMGAGAAICYASGFNEVGATERHNRLIEAAGDMPVIGPNCYGFINAISGAALWPDQHGLQRVDKGVAIFSSSGNVSVNLSMQQRSLSIGLIVTVGNQAMVSIEQGIEAVLEDPCITAIGIHIEGLQNLPKFVGLAQRALLLKKPIVALKTGRSEIGARITMSHTATLAGESVLYDALFKRLGIANVDNLEDFIETLKLVAVTGGLPTGRIAAMSCSGGEASLIADLCMRANQNRKSADEIAMHFPALRDDHKALVGATLNEYVAVDNPLDYHTFIWGDLLRMQQTFAAMMAGGFDLTLLMLDYPCVNDCDMAEWITAGDAFVAAAKQSGAKGAIVASLAESVPASIRDALMRRGVVPLLGLSHAVNAVKAAVTVGCAEPWLPALPTANTVVAGDAVYALSEYDSKQQLAEFGLTIANSALVDDHQQAVNAAIQIGFPLAIKISGDSLNHKTEFNGVALNVCNLEQLESRVADLFTLSAQLLIERMVTDAVAELLVGVSYDPQFGHYMIIGFGGILVELIADRQIILLPASDAYIRSALMRLKIAPLLQGYRGKPAADIDAVVDCVQKLGRYIQHNAERLITIDINPLMVGAKGFGATVADAMIVFRTRQDKLEND